MLKKILILTLVLCSFFTHQKAEANTANCAMPTMVLASGLVGPMNQASRMAIINTIKDCFLTAANSAWQSIRQTGSDLASAANCFWHPIDCMESIREGVQNAYNFVTNFASRMNEMWNNLTHMSAQQVGELLCSVLGSLAPDLLVAILTGGAASGRLGPTLARLMLKVRKIAAIVKAGVSLPVRMLVSLGDEALEKLKKIYRNGNKRLFEARLRRSGCAL
jgi:hypothetical protein